MNLLKKFGRGVSSGFLKLSLFLFAVSFALVSVLGTPDKLKQSLSGSEVYSVAVQEGIDAAAEAQEEQGGQADALSLSSPEIRESATAAFTPDKIEEWTGQVIDGMYGWLDGDTAQPEFSIDTTEQRQAFAQNVADRVEQRVEGLRPCTRQEALQLSRQEIDLFNLPCRPPIDLAGEKQRLINEIQSNNEFLGDSLITPTDLTANSAQPNPFANSPLPDVFQSVRRLPMITGIIGIICIAGLLWLSEDKRRAIRKIGITFLGSGLVLIISAVLFNYVFNQAGQPGGTFSRLPLVSEGGIQAPLLDVVKSLVDVFNEKIIFVSIIYLIIGVGILVTLHYRGRTSNAQRFRA